MAGAFQRPKVRQAIHEYAGKRYFIVSQNCQGQPRCRANAPSSAAFLVQSTQNFVPSLATPACMRFAVVRTQAQKLQETSRSSSTASSEARLAAHCTGLSHCGCCPASVGGLGSAITPHVDINIHPGPRPMSKTTWTRWKPRVSCAAAQARPSERVYLLGFWPVNSPRDQDSP